jgi:hypothetical protein
VLCKACQGSHAPRIPRSARSAEILLGQYVVLEVGFLVWLL